LSETEILVVTHGSFAHFLFNRWEDEPSKSGSCSRHLLSGHVSFTTLPGSGLPGNDITMFRAWFGPGYPISIDFLDYISEVVDRGARDCGIFTKEKVRYAQVKAGSQSNVKGLSHWE